MPPQPKAELLVLAELNPDVVVRCSEADVRFGQVEQLVERGSLTLGSSGAITASAAVAQDVRVAMCGVIGDDVAGRLVMQLLAERGVDTDAVILRPGLATGMTVVLSNPNGDRALLTFPGTMAALRVGDVPDHLLAGVRHVHISSIYLQTGLHAGLPQLLAAAHRHGATTSVDPGWDPAQDWTALLPLLGELDYVLPNTQEVLAIARASGAEIAADTVEAALALAALGPAVVVKDGPSGALVVEHDTIHRVTAPAVPVVDTTGAGDNFDGGFLAALLDGADAVEAACRGVVSGSLSVQGWGGTGRHADRTEAIDAASRLRPVPRSPVPTKESR